MLPRSILVAYDFSEPSRRALEWARTLRERLDASVTVVHVDVDPLGGMKRSQSAKETSADVARRHDELEAQMRRAVAEVFGAEQERVNVRVVPGTSAVDIGEAARELDVDLIVLGASGKNAVERLLLGSVTQSIVRSSPIPTLVVQ
jgi:nucleotide-binding universal stress UspA family protein